MIFLFTQGRLQIRIFYFYSSSVNVNLSSLHLNMWQPVCSAGILDTDVSGVFTAKFLPIPYMFVCKKGKPFRKRESWVEIFYNLIVRLSNKISSWRTDIACLKFYTFLWSMQGAESWTQHWSTVIQTLLNCDFVQWLVIVVLLLLTYLSPSYTVVASPL